ncbi:MAG: ethanolamine ammonia-lyase subunit EutC [Rubrivivax sp.]|nr:ethanolamine ammonia-lyase subunit EutC [Rubrivivax sp.]
MKSPVIDAPWLGLRGYTDARIALGRAGHSQPTAAHLALQLAQAQARDAVQLPLDTLGVAAALQSIGLQTLLLHSAASDRAAYLLRPDLGRRLDAASQQRLRECIAPGQRYDVAFVIADGLSALAIHQNAAPLLQAVLQGLAADDPPWRVAPVAVVEQGRVAVGDEAGAALHADTVVVLIGERPGLSSPDSLGLYLTWAPRPGRSDAERNCISNVRPAGLSAAAAAAQLQRLLSLARRRRLSGVSLKDEPPAAVPAGAGSVLLGLPPWPQSPSTPPQERR